MEVDNLRISVIITSNNQKDHLIEAVESVINQTAKPHEILIADDYSVDGESIGCIKDYELRYPGWIKGIFQKNKVGVPKNKNAGLREVTGNHVAILDGDDRFLPNKLEKEKTILQRNPTAQCVYSNVHLIDAVGNAARTRDKHEQPSGDIFSYVAQGQFGLLRSMLIDYKLLEKTGFIDERFVKYHDFDLTLHLAKQCQFAYSMEPLVECRERPADHPENLTIQDHLCELQGIYHKMQALLTDLVVTEQKTIVQAWYDLLLSFLKRLPVDELIDQEELSRNLHFLLMPLLAETQQLIKKLHAYQEQQENLTLQLEQQAKQLEFQTDLLKAQNQQLHRQDEELKVKQQLIKLKDQQIKLKDQQIEDAVPWRRVIAILGRLKR
jgi:glycosyltransferase involved in cell wall biosynthesis